MEYANMEYGNDDYQRRMNNVLLNIAREQDNYGGNIPKGSKCAAKYKSGPKKNKCKEWSMPKASTGKKLSPFVGNLPQVPDVQFDPLPDLELIRGNGCAMCATCPNCGYQTKMDGAALNPYEEYYNTGGKVCLKKYRKNNKEKKNPKSCMKWDMTAKSLNKKIVKPKAKPKVNKKPSKWIQFIKNIREKHPNLSYKEAMSVASEQKLVNPNMIKSQIY